MVGGDGDAFFDAWCVVAISRARGGGVRGFDVIIAFADNRVGSPRLFFFFFFFCLLVGKATNLSSLFCELFLISTRIKRRERRSRGEEGERRRGREEKRSLFLYNLRGRLVCYV